MTLEDALIIADDTLKAFNHEGLTDIQRMILKDSFHGKTYEEIAEETGYSTQHIKNKGTELWNLLSQASGKDVKKTNFKGVLEEILKSGKTIPKSPTPNLYNSDNWVGREDLINELSEKFKLNTRILWLIGISGVGKTALGECLAVKTWTENNPFEWVSVEIFDQEYSFTRGVEKILAKLGETNIDPQERNDPEKIGKRLLNKLKSNTYWIQIDSVERLINAEDNTFIDNYWLPFFRDCLDPKFPSRFVFTSQVLPTEIGELGDRYSNILHIETLSGLSTNEQLEFFSNAGILVNESNTSILSQIGEVYEGHPLVLEVITGEIRQDYDNDVTEYWEENKQEFEQIKRELSSDRLSLALYNIELQKRIRQRIEKSLKQLSDNALTLLKRSSVYRRPVPRNFWVEMLWDNSEEEKQTAYIQLSDRSLIETEKRLIRQHNLIRDIAYDLLREDIEVWKATEQKAAEIWLKNLDNLLQNLFQDADKNHWSFLPEDISGKPIDEIISSKNNTISDLTELDFIIEIYNHFFESSCYQKSATALFLIDRYWYRWGNLNNLLECINNLSDSTDKLESQNVTIPQQIIIRKARILLDLGNAQEAIKIAKTLKKSDSNTDIIVSAVANSLVGSAYMILGNYNKAIEAYNEALGKHIQNKNMKGISSTYGHIGDAYFELNNLEQAIKNYEEACKNAKTDYYRGRNSWRIGKVYLKQKEYNKSIETLENSLNQMTEHEDKKLSKNSLDIAKVRLDLGKAWIGNKDLSKATKYLQLAQRTFKIQNIKEFITECEELLLKIEETNNE